MTLVKSISGIRGTIGGTVGEGLSPIDLVKFTTGYAEWLKHYRGKKNCTVVVGRDARLSGSMVSNIVIGTLMGCGCNVVNIGLATTPTTELAVTMEGADGGIILTASHNPKQWNALKLLNEKGEFLNKEQGEEMLRLAESDDIVYTEVDTLGSCVEKTDYIKRHIDEVLKLKLVDPEAIRAAKFRVAVDAVNSVGGVAIPQLLRALGVEQIEELNCEPTGNFAHNPEPLPEYLTEISEHIRQNKADVGFVVDPDVDRLAIVCENGEMFGEEYTLVSIADYVLTHTPGNTVSNLSSTRALRDVTNAHGCTYTASAVGEVNVVTKMRETNAIIGGEGNGGVIYPACHAGRDALVGICLFLSHLAHEKKTVSELRATYPAYFMGKNRIDLKPGCDVDAILEKIKATYAGKAEINTVDGVKLDFPETWVHLRKSNTEPIIRIYSEGPTQEAADAIGEEILALANSLM
jgi:phosphomannomutase